MVVTFEVGKHHNCRRIAVIIIEYLYSDLKLPRASRRTAEIESKSLRWK